MNGIFPEYQVNQTRRMIFGQGPGPQGRGFNMRGFNMVQHDALTETIQGKPSLSGLKWCMYSTYSQPMKVWKAEGASAPTVNLPLKQMVISPFEIEVGLYKTPVSFLNNPNSRYRFVPSYSFLGWQRIGSIWKCKLS